MNIMRNYITPLLFFVSIGVFAQVDKKAKTYPVEWVELEGLQYDQRSGQLEKVANEESWGFAGAISSNVLEANTDGFVAFNAIRQSDYRFIGLSNENIDANYTSLEHALYLTGSNIYICQDGKIGSAVGKYREGDLFSIERRGAWMLFNHNDKLIYRVEVDPTKHLFVDVALSGVYVQLEDVVTTFPPTKYPYGPIDPFPDQGGTKPDCVDNTMNWISSTGYDKDGNIIASAKSYSNYLGKPLQSQQMNLTENQVLASQPLYDKYGRPVIQTLNAPINKNQFCYKEDFVTNQLGEIYDYEDFDVPNNTTSENYIASGEIDSPKKVGDIQEGTLGWYYSDNNTEESYVATTGYPYSRVEYDKNNPGKQKRVASPGNYHRMGKGHESESYTMLEAGELKYVYGPLQSWLESEGKPGYQITKTINIDPDGKQVVSFSDLDGKLIASCMSGQVEGQNQNTLAVSSFIGELGYVDIHLSEGCENSLELFNDGTLVYNILNLQTDKYVLFSGEQSFTGTMPNLEPGFYRIIELTDYSQYIDIELIYDLNYYEFALNYYDKASRLVKTVPPLGIDKAFLQEGLVVTESTNSNSADLYCIASLNDVCSGLSFDQTNKLELSLDPLAAIGNIASSDLTIRFKKKAELIGVDVFDIEPEHRLSFTEGYEHEDYLYALNRSKVRVNTGQSFLQTKRAARSSKSNFAFNSILRESIGFNNIDDVSGPDDPLPPYPDPSPNSISNEHVYILRFNVYSSSATNEDPDIINKGSIYINREVNDNGETISVTGQDRYAIISSEIRTNSNDITLEIHSFEKWEESNGVSELVDLTTSDFTFLEDYEVQIIAENEESSVIYHSMQEEYEYNSLGWLLSSTAPDGGQTEYNYRKDGSLRFSQNAKQREQVNFSYTNYDKIGRVVEVGEYRAFSSPSPLVSYVSHGHIYYAASDAEIPLVNFIAHGNPSFTANVQGATNTLMLLDQNDGLEDSQCHQNTFFSYDKPDSDFEIETGLSSDNYIQRFVRGKLSKSWTDKPHTNTTWYSYDEQGRTTWMVQKVEGLGVKTVDYMYDTKGNVHQVIYQKNNPQEAFYHKYLYDADNRLAEVFTSTDNTAWEKEAEYQYYLHGPLKRVELAEDLQGIDYLYTVQGQLKSINSPNIGASATNVYSDPGEDGQNAFATDVFGMSIDYYSGDYARAGTNVNYTTPNQSSFAGNISSVRWNTQGMSLANIGKQNIYTYDYEHHNWLSGATFGSYNPNTCQNAEQGAVYCSMLDEYQTLEKGDAIGPNTFSFSFNTVPNVNEDYKVSNISYDANGNLLSLHRNGYTDPTNNLTNVMDAMSYHYLEDDEGTRIDNKLRHISDVNHDNEGLGDISSQQNNNYQYNEIGQLIYNNEEGHYYTYDAYGLLIGVYKDENYTEPVAEYFYDDKGFRSKKVLYDSDNANLQTHATWYIRDASGNLLSLYDQDLTQESAITAQTEVPIYAVSRIGQYQADNNGQKIYEITDHLGSVRALLSRTKNEDGSANVLSYSDYYPFGMPMPGRVLSSENYRYDYQGQYAEKDGETSLNSFELRQWDARIARWNSMDPYGQYFSPYMGMGNNPILSVDPDGGWDDEWLVNADGSLTWLSDAGGDEIQYLHFGEGTGLEGNMVVALGNFESELSIVDMFSTSDLDFTDMSSVNNADVINFYTDIDAYSQGSEFVSNPITGAQTTGTLGIAESNIIPELLVGATTFKAVGKVFGPLKNWFRVGTGYNQFNEPTVRAAWGAGKKKFLNEIGSKNLQGLNSRVRKFGDGHFHFYKTKGHNSWIPKGW